MYKRAFSLLNELCEKNEQFKTLVLENIKKGNVRYFNDLEWEKIKKQNYISNINGVNEFIDIFEHGLNIGDCVGVSYQLSYSYDDVDIVSGILPILKGTKNALNEGGHRWLESKTHIIDTSLMLVIDKCVKNDFGYIEEERLDSYTLRTLTNYMARKEFVNDEELRRKM